MFSIREFSKEDTKRLLEIHDPSLLTLPDLDSPLNIVRLTLENNGGIKGFVFTKLTSEIMLVLDKSLPYLQKALAVKEIEPILVQKIFHEQGLDDTYVYTDSDRFKTFLEKHLKFHQTAKHSLYRSIKYGW